MSVELLSIQVGRVQAYQELNGKRWESAIAKSPVEGPVRVQKEKLEGDEQSDLVHHGGIDKAILAYSAEHFSQWANEPELADSDWNPTAGTFGENLTLSGQTEENVCIGDIYSIGSCRLQVSQPRQPCWKLSRRWRLPKLAVQVQKTGRTGWYFRVLQEGLIESGNFIELVDRPNPEWTVAKAHGVMHAKPRNASDDLELSRCQELSKSWAEQLANRAQKSIEKSEAARLFGPDGESNS